LEHLGIQLATAIREKNEAVLQHKKLRATVEAMDNEQVLLQKELDDRSRQVQALLREQHLLKGGHPSTLPTESELGVQSGADAIISQRLVVFRNIEELQAQNQSLLRSIRSLSSKMETFEQSKQSEEENLRLEALNESARLIEQLQEQLRRETLNSESFARERDQWRRIAETRGFNSPRPSPQQTPEPGMHPQSVPVTPSRNANDYEQFYRDLQREFDQYRKECGTDTKLLKNQLEQKQQECTDMSIQVAKLNNQINYLNERHELVLQNIETKNREFEQLRERIASLNTMSGKQDAKIEELSQSLATARQAVDQLNNENQQLKIEREIFKNSETRSANEIKELVRERNSANQRIRELQLHLEELTRKHELQMSKLQDKLDEMTRDLQLSRKHLADIMDDNRTLAAKRDAELRESQIKIEKLNVDYERIKGDYALTKNKEENAVAKVADLTAKISLLEKRSIHFEGRVAQGVLGDLSSDQQRLIESDLAQTRIELEATKSELALAKDQADAYKAISQASEDRLAEMNNSYDVYQADMQLKIGQLQTRIQEMETERHELEEKLAKIGADLNETQERMDAQVLDFNSSKELYERQLSTARESEEQALRSVGGIKADLERQAQAVEEARSNYEREVIAHSASLQQIGQLKQMNQSLKEQRDEALVSQRTALESVTSSQATFDRVRAKLESDVQELERRIQDLVQQNELLHSQFEQLSLSKGVDENVGSEPNSIAELGEVIKYLRREKEIVQTKLEIALQEADRSRLQIDHLQKALDENRLLLEEERKRALESTGTDRRHHELLEKIEQSNLLRESNITLRNQFEAAQEKISVLEGKLRDALLELEPLKQKVYQLESEIEVRKAEAKSLLEDNQRWKGRAQQILEKYERIDPVEHESLKNNVKILSAEKDVALEELKKLQGMMTAKLAEKENQVKTLETMISAMKQEKDQLLASKDSEIFQLKDLENNEKYTTLAKELAEQKEKYSTMTANANQKLEGAFAKLREARRQVKELTQVSLFDF
jgi:nucleoprotein TPR